MAGLLAERKRRLLGLALHHSQEGLRIALQIEPLAVGMHRVFDLDHPVIELDLFSRGEALLAAHGLDLRLLIGGKLLVGPGGRAEAGPERDGEERRGKAQERFPLA